MKNVPNWFLAVLFILTTANCQSNEGLAKKAIISGDSVRVRAKPSLDGPPLGAVYKNMLVEVVAKSSEESEIGGEKYPWYQIKVGDLTGWCFGKFISFDIPPGSVDTYDAAGDMEWFHKRFGYSTWYDEGIFNIDSFSLDEYRELIKAAGSGNEHAFIALRGSLFKHLKEHPKDAKYEYLKKKVHSRDYLIKLFRHAPNCTVEIARDVIPDSMLKNRNDVKALVSIKGSILGAADERLQMDPELVSLAINSDPNVFNLLPEKVKKNRSLAMSAAIKNPYLLQSQEFPEEFKNDQAFLVEVAARNPSQIYYVGESIKGKPEVLAEIYYKGYKANPANNHLLYYHLREYSKNEEFVLSLAQKFNKDKICPFKDFVRETPLSEKMRKINPACE